jgi:hypothetical protein
VNAMQNAVGCVSHRKLVGGLARILLDAISSGRAEPGPRPQQRSALRLGRNSYAISFSSRS